ncbi:hypothetical protein JYU34_002502 [Plutella xylostella]|uniref:Uncharacterized protein n=1 Tax=Plutella xylostella TaxID=51655 RepID=A0ABQ7R2E6_PLUXY|nr:hypothetical protein JYU34_002502 [Plutella xylostella]
MKNKLKTTFLFSGGIKRAVTGEKNKECTYTQARTHPGAFQPPPPPPPPPPRRPGRALSR